MRYRKIGLTTVAVTQDLLSRMAWMLKILYSADATVPSILITDDLRSEFVMKVIPFKLAGVYFGEHDYSV